MPRKEWYAKNPEKAREQSLNSYRKHRAARVENMREWRESHPEKVDEQSRHSDKRKKQRKEENKERIRQYKLEHPCRCGYSDPRALVFHHREPHKKEFPISRRLSLSWDKLKVEISKCDVLCSNCHLILHSD
jgi:hypothetical protein